MREIFSYEFPPLVRGLTLVFFEDPVPIRNIPDSNPLSHDFCIFLSCRKIDTEKRQPREKVSYRIITEQWEMRTCGEPDSNRRTPSRIDLESIAVGQAWLSPLGVG